jgi:hypothetical protein
VTRTLLRDSRSLDLRHVVPSPGEFALAGQHGLIVGSMHEQERRAVRGNKNPSGDGHRERSDRARGLDLPHHTQQQEQEGLRRINPGG